jgi:hypothetical protein
MAVSGHIRPFAALPRAKPFPLPTAWKIISQSVLERYGED